MGKAQRQGSPLADHRENDQEADGLRNGGRKTRSADSHAEAEDQDRVEGDVQEGARDDADH